MNKTIKVIDLLNMQYKNEKMPKNIRIKYPFVFDYYTYNEEMKWYETADKTTILDVFHKLDYEVEIIEEEPEIDIQELKELEYVEDYEADKTDIRLNRDKINELIRAIKQIDKKLKGE